MKHYDFHFDRKSVASNGAVIIEGFSNKNVSDRVNERMNPKGGRLDNYRKNPVVLFNHGKDEAFGIMPIGKALTVEPMEEGLYTRCHISNSKTEKITVVRDLVQEEILKTFSLGYETFTEGKDADGTTVLQDWELLEQSIVPIPMNQDSIGSLVKRYKRLGNNFGCKYLEFAALSSRGALVAAALQRRLHDMIASKAITDRTKAMASVAEIAGCKMMDVQEVVAGDRPLLSPAMVKGFSTVLGVKEEELSNIRQMEIDMGKRGKKSAEGKQEEEKKIEQTEVKSEQAGGQMVLHTISVPKAMFDEAENAKGHVESHGYKADQMSEDDSGFHFQQANCDELDMEKGISIDMGEGVVGKAAPRKGMQTPEQKPEDKPEEKPEEKASDDPKPEDLPKEEEKEPLKEEEKKEAAKPGDLLRQALETGDNHDRMRQLVEQALIMLGDGKGGEKSLPPMPSGADAVGQDENPYLMAARQTNALLGTLIVEIQKLSDSLKGQAPKPEEPQTTSSDDPEQIKALASLREYQQTIDMRLKRLGV